MKRCLLKMTTMEWYYYNDGIGCMVADTLVYTLMSSVPVCIRSEKKPPEAIWLMWQAPATLLEGVSLDAITIWRAYLFRWPIEPNIRFRKQALHWNRPQFHHKASGDRWSWLIALAIWILFLSKDLITDSPFPWQKVQVKFTPQRVLQSLSPLFVQFGSPTSPPINYVESLPAGLEGDLVRKKHAFLSLKSQLYQHRLQNSIIKVLLISNQGGSFCLNARLLEKLERRFYIPNEKTPYDGRFF